MMIMTDMRTYERYAKPAATHSLFFLDLKDGKRRAAERDQMLVVKLHIFEIRTVLQVLIFIKNHEQKGRVERRNLQGGGNSCRPWRMEEK